MAADGKLLPSDLIWTESIPNWVPATKLKGLFAEISPVQPPPLPVNPETAAPPAIDQAPTVASKRENFWVSLVVGAVLVVIFLMAIGKASNSGSVEDLKKASASDFIDASTLTREYGGNEAAGNAKWKGNYVLVEGEVFKVEGSDCIQLRGHGIHLVNCTVKSSQSKDLLQLRRGSYVRIRGKCDGINGLSGNVKLESCVFLKVND